MAGIFRYCCIQSWFVLFFGVAWGSWACCSQAVFILKNKYFRANIHHQPYIWRVVISSVWNRNNSIRFSLHERLISTKICGHTIMHVRLYHMGTSRMRKIQIITMLFGAWELNGVNIPSGIVQNIFPCTGTLQNFSLQLNCFKPTRKISLFLNRSCILQ